VKILAGKVLDLRGVIYPTELRNERVRSLR
jgi:hypothetical protein